MRNTRLLLFMLAFVAAVFMSSCSDSESYAELLEKERHATNAYLANCRVVNEIPSDTVFEVGKDAPYYRIDPEGNIYMQVLKAGDRKNDKVKDSEKIYFRYMRYDLYYWYTYGEMLGDGNENDMNLSPTYFNYGNYALANSAQWGYGIQMPLKFLGVDSEVNLIIKSQYGLASEISNVRPYLYHLRYFRNQI
ncbi:MAG: DUF4827 family protein [Muribaculaceae bacterium]|nr:DUF4827 family protein [Muribaculaceae bacterium]